jgi:hypothetical protein
MTQVVEPALEATLSYEDVLRLFQKLSVVEQRKMMAHVERKHDERIQEILHIASQRELTAEEHIELMDLNVSFAHVNPSFSLRREDWYDNDGR